MIQLNLLPDVKREFLRTQQMRIKVISGAFFLTAGAVAATVILALWVYGAQELHKNSLTANIKESFAELKKVEDISKYVTIQNQLTAVTALHDSKNHLSRLLDYLPAINSGVTLNTVILADDTKSLTFEGQTPDYTALVKFRDTLVAASLKHADQNNAMQKTKLFDSVTIDTNSVGVTEGNESIVSFKITAVYTTNAFKSVISKPEVEVLKQDTTPSTVGTPKAVFDQTKETE